MKGGATMEERAVAARIREKYDGSLIDVPMELRAPADRRKNFRPIKHYMNSVVHDNTDYPVDKLVLKDQNDRDLIVQYNPYDFQNLANYVLTTPEFQVRPNTRDQSGKLIKAYIKGRWMGF